MAAHEDGEVEVVLGNKQLFAVLFVFVVLLGIFFALGFLAGQSTDNAVSQTASNTSQTPSQSTRSTPASVAETPTEPPRQSLPLVTEPAPTKPAEPQATSTPPSPASDAALEAPPPGRYLQVAATERARDAEAMLTMLRKEGFEGLLTPSRRVPSLTAILVGPFPSSDAIATAREKLKKLNIDKPFAVEYK